MQGSFRECSVYRMEENMLRKICPFCEKTMTWSHYCSDCRRFVKKPYIRDITYYLNESHPTLEKNCDYHGRAWETAGNQVPESRASWNSGPWNGTSQNSGSGYGMPGRASGNGMSWQTPGSGMSGQKQGDRSSGSGKTKTAGSQHRAKERENGKKPTDVLLGQAWGRQQVGIAVIVLLILIQVLSVAKGASGSFFRRKESVSYGGQVEEEYQLLSDEEVQARGIACNANSHYSITGAAMIDQMREIISETGCQVEEALPSSWNYEENSGELDWTDYSTTVEFRLKQAGQEEGTVPDTVTVSYDTATEQLHGISIFVSDEAVAASMTEGVLNFLQEQGEIPPDADYGVQVSGEMLRYTDREKEKDEELGGWREIPEDQDDYTEVYYQEYEDTFYVRIWKVSY